MNWFFDQSQYSKAVKIHTRDARVLTVDFGQDETAAESFASLIRFRAFEEATPGSHTFVPFCFTLIRE